MEKKREGQGTKTAAIVALVMLFTGAIITAVATAGKETLFFTNESDELYCLNNGTITQECQTNDTLMYNKTPSIQSFMNRSDWTSIDDYPAPCNTGYVVQGLADTLQCTEDATCDGQTCNIDNTGTLDGHEGTYYLDNTNAETICTGTDTYLDGEGNCDDIKSTYVDQTGDNITGEIDMNNNNITSVQCIIFQNGARWCTA